MVIFQFNDKVNMIIVAEKTFGTATRLNDRIQQLRK